jgi:hypothetical protein
MPDCELLEEQWEQGRNRKVTQQTVHRWEQPQFLERSSCVLMTPVSPLFRRSVRPNCRGGESMSMTVEE